MRRSLSGQSRTVVPAFVRVIRIDVQQLRQGDYWHTVHRGAISSESEFAPVCVWSMRRGVLERGAAPHPTAQVRGAMMTSDMPSALLERIRYLSMPYDSLERRGTWALQEGEMRSAPNQARLPFRAEQ